MEVWNGDLILNNGHSISDIHISAPNTTCAVLPPTTQLRYLALVDPSRIPLYLIHGPRLDVWTAKEETESWFSSALLNEYVDEEEEAEWWHTARPESPLGVLVAVEYTKAVPTGQPRVTEILFFASRTYISSSCSPPTPPQSSQEKDPTATDSPTITIHALTLSSELLAEVRDIAPAISTPVNPTDPIEATFLPEPATQTSRPSTANPLKRKSINDTFNEADAIRKRIRSKPGESVQAASYITPSMPSLKQMNSNALESRSSTSRPSSASGPSVPMQTRPLSRSSSISSIRASSMARPTTSTEPTKPSGLAQMQSASVDVGLHVGCVEDKEIEQKNKDTLSRLVMAGMRLYGLSQSKAKKNARRASMAPNNIATQSALLARSESPSLPQQASSPVLNPEGDEEEERRKEKDEEYRYIYHQAYKGACFAFRSRIAKESFQPHTETLREVVDKLLAMFCVDPLAAGLPGVADAKVTPGGRKIFDTPGEEERSGKTVLGKKL